ncbi:ABC transporter permease [Eubacterium maltosivorans]|uniref:ABC transporter permease n=1 Tax=Eubacterium maltosivorans TaxID=2041044 RepID=UPI003A92A901
MLKNAVLTEGLKLRGSKIALPIILLPLISVLLGSGNYAVNPHELTNGWYSLWTQVALFYGYFFYPIIIAICCAYIMRLEKNNHNWNAVMTYPVRPRTVILSKLIIIGFISLIVQAFLIILYLTAGLLLGVKGSFPLDILNFCLCGFTASLAVAAIQLYLSMVIKSFALPIGICLGTCVLGLGLCVTGLWMLYPTSLLVKSFGALNQAALSPREFILFFILSALYLFVFTRLAIRRLTRRDIVTP